MNNKIYFILGSLAVVFATAFFCFGYKDLKVFQSISLFLLGIIFLALSIILYFRTKKEETKNNEMEPTSRVLAFRLFLSGIVFIAVAFL